MQEVLAQQDSLVSAGNQIGTIGESGHADGPHTHVEFRAGSLESEVLNVLEFFIATIDGLRETLVDENGNPLFPNMWV
jgi:murein DD-endopeptidase MepM/ murein hydrolase activator NlpD